MAYLNKIMLIGNLTRDIEVRFTPTGVAIGSFGIAVNTPIGKDEKGNTKTETLFIDAVIFGKYAEAIAEYLKKGSLIYLEGRLRYRTWEDANGLKKSKHEIIVEKIEFLSRKENSQNNIDNANDYQPDEDEDIPF